MQSRIIDTIVFMSRPRDFAFDYPVEFSDCGPVSTIGVDRCQVYYLGEYLGDLDTGHIDQMFAGAKELLRENMLCGWLDTGAFIGGSKDAYRDARVQ